ncbi:MAG: hypothetical protein IJG51_09835 [Synergistaceae bacterium]|nr:hypothetical protein [Synergistaceae bacterium]MBQ3345726.1 hypothetical protein [Synergistaceae bacterium]MBQ3399178.1 hypothetical protein [Synergistaceae bacterium]MBQ3758010.1 hypothetical protein [Synergistaceae bacterium]MBQ6001367.1 hypothetical protein [Synergistaceae bacterium]
MRVEVSDVKDKLPELVGLIVSEQEDDIVISIHGIPAVKMERYVQPDVSKRIGVAKGKFIVPDDFDTMKPSHAPTTLPRTKTPSTAS